MFIDVIFLILMVMAVFKGFSRGLIIAVLSFIAMIIGLAAALKLSAVVANYLQTNMHIQGKWLPVLSFIIVFSAVVILVRWVAILLKKAVGLVLLGWLDKIGGIALYVLMYTLVYSVTLFYASQLRVISIPIQQESKTYAYIQPIGPKVINGLGQVIPLFSNLFADLTRFFGNLSSHSK